MTTRTLLKFSVAAALMGLSGLSFATQEHLQPRQGDDLSGLHAFDLRAGCWNYHNHVLKERLANNHDWFDYDSIQHLWITMGGYGNMDDNEMRRPDGTYYGLTVRTYDPKTGTWSIWWHDGRKPGDLDRPVKGRFKVRFTWSGISATAAHHHAREPPFAAALAMQVGFERRSKAGIDCSQNCNCIAKQIWSVQVTQN